MASVWYIGRADIRSISIAEWLSAGLVSDSNDSWDKTNGWSISESSFTPEQLSYIATLSYEFAVGQPNGPRPGGSILPEAPLPASLNAEGKLLQSQVPEYLADLDGTLSELTDQSGGAFSTKLTNTFVRFVDQNGDPLPAGSLTTIHVNTVTGDIDDITFEEV